MRAFISFTRELADHPTPEQSYVAAATAACREAGFEPATMDDSDLFYPTAEEPASRCRQALTDCQVWIGLIGLRAGSTVPGNEETFVQLEYRTARELGLELVPVLLSYDRPVIGLAPKHLQLSTAQDGFRKSLDQLHTRKEIASPAEAKEAVAASLAALIRGGRIVENYLFGQLPDQPSLKIVKERASPELVRAPDAHFDHVKALLLASVTTSWIEYRTTASSFESDDDPRKRYNVKSNSEIAALAPTLPAGEHMFVSEETIEDRPCPTCAGSMRLKCAACGGTGNSISVFPNPTSVVIEPVTLKDFGERNQLSGFRSPNPEYSIDTGPTVSVGCSVCNGSGAMGCPTCRTGHHFEYKLVKVEARKRQESVPQVHQFGDHRVSLDGGCFYWEGGSLPDITISAPIVQIPRKMLSKIVDDAWFSEAERQVRQIPTDRKVESMVHLLPLYSFEYNVRGATHTGFLVGRDLRPVLPAEARWDVRRRRYAADAKDRYESLSAWVLEHPRSAAALGALLVVLMVAIVVQAAV